MQGSSNTYLMEHSEEAVRLDVKTNPEAVRDQAGLCGIGPGAHVLDVGCGSGLLLQGRHASQLLACDAGLCQSPALDLVGGHAGRGDLLLQRGLHLFELLVRGLQLLAGRDFGLQRLDQLQPLRTKPTGGQPHSLDLRLAAAHLGRLLAQAVHQGVGVVA